MRGFDLLRRLLRGVRLHRRLLRVELRIAAVPVTRTSTRANLANMRVLSSGLGWSGVLVVCLLCTAACGGDEFSSDATGGTSSGGASGGTTNGGSGGSSASGGSAGVSTSGGGTAGAPSGGGTAGAPSGGGGGTPSVGAWPDSYSQFCTDGASGAPCPTAGNEGYGQDGNYLLNVPNYVLTNADVVTDPITQLVWQRATPELEMDWTTAFAYCNNLSLDGHNDWRLASRLEILSIMDFGSSNLHPQPAFNTNAQPQPYWTSTSYLGDSSTHWIVDYGDAATFPENDSSIHYPRCVRGTPISGDFTPISEQDAILDGRTGLTWQRMLPSDLQDWYGALGYCENLDLAGFSDWRLPSLKELRSIVSDTHASPAVDTSLFGFTQAAPYWTSTPHPANPTGAMIVNFDGGGNGGLGPITSGSVVARVRCVR